MNYGRYTKAELIKHAEWQDARARKDADRINELLRDLHKLEEEKSDREMTALEAAEKLLEENTVTSLYGLGPAEYHALKDFAKSQSEGWFSEFLVSLADAAWSADGVTLVKGLS